MNAARSAAPAVVPGAPVGVSEELPFEAALAQLEDIVRQLEQGNVALDRSVEIYERGEALKRYCESLLKQAETRIQRITLGSDGQAASVAPLDVD